jgi:hypothetical protein
MSVWACGAVGSAPDWQSGGHRFEPGQVHSKFIGFTATVPVAFLVRGKEMYMTDVIVIVWDKRITISVHQKSKSVWVANGAYMGKPIETKGSTQGAAIKRWRDAAEYTGNG